MTASACHKDPISPMTISDTLMIKKNMQVIWQTPHFPDTTHTDLITILGTYNGNSLYEFSLNQPIRYKYYDMLSGLNIWTWDQNLPIDFTFQPKQIGFYKNYFIGNNGDHRFAINLESGQTEWHTEISSPNSCGSPRIGIINNQIYHSVNDCSSSGSFAALIRTNIDNLEQDTILTMSKNELDGYSPDFESFALWIDSNQDSILIFQNRMINWSTNKYRTDFYAYNLRTKAFTWKKTNLTPSGNSSVWDPIIWEDKVYFQGAGEIFCIDAETGDIIWTKQFDLYTQHLLFTKSIIRDGKLFVHPEGNTLFALDPFTGNTIWKSENVGGAPSHELQYHNGIIYWAWDAIWAVDGNSGKVIWQEYSPNFTFRHPASFGNNGIHIDATRGVLFTSDNYYAMCIKLIR